MEDVELQSPEVTQPEAIEPVEQQEPSTLLDAINAELDGKTDDGVSRDEKGRFAKKEETPTSETKPEEQKPEVQKAEAKPADETEMPEGLSSKAQDRFRNLVTRLHEKDDQIAQANEVIGEFRQMIQSTGATAEEFSRAIDYMTRIKSGDLEGALTMLDQQRQMIAFALGKPLPGADPLAQYPDLRQAVEAYRMDEQAAMEIARAREFQRQQTSAHERQQQATQAQHNEMAQRQQAVTAIDQMTAQWAKTDPDFTAKEELILKQLPEIASNFPPSMWQQQVRILYNTISAMPMARPAQAAPAPLRASGQSAGAKQPASMLEALEGALGYSAG